MKISLMYGTAPALLVGMAIVSGCSSPPQGGPEVSPSESLAPVAGQVVEGAYSGQQFSFVSYGGAPQEINMQILQEFAEKAGAAVAGDSPPEGAKLQAQVGSGNVTWDIYATSSIDAARECGKLFEPWDFSLIDISKIPKGVQVGDCAVPGTIFSTGLAYDASVLKTAPTSYKDFFNTKDFPGKRTLWSGDPEMNLEIALLADGVPADKLYPLDLERAFAKLDTIRDDLVFYATGAEQEQILESGRAIMGLTWTGRVFNVNQNGSNWKYVHEAPQVSRETVYSLVKGSKNGKVSASAMNYMLGADQQTFLQEKNAYPALNIDATPNLSDNAKAVDVLKPPFAPLVNMDVDFWAKNKAAILDKWVGWTSGS